jgi:hypothetical protein
MVQSCLSGAAVTNDVRNIAAHCDCAHAGVLLWRRSPEAHAWLSTWWRHAQTGRYSGYYQDQSCLKVR